MGPILPPVIPGMLGNNENTNFGIHGFEMLEAAPPINFGRGAFQLLFSESASSTIWAHKHAHETPSLLSASTNAE